MTEQQRAELVQNIIQVCNCNADAAQKLLSYCNWDVLAAINLHFTGFDINKIPQSNVPAAATLVQSLNHDLYISFQEEAKKLNKWAIVYIKMSKKDVCIFDRFSMYDYIGTKFHCLSLEPEDSCTKWFIDYFNISVSPSLAIINPFSGELVDKLLTDLSSSRVTNFLNTFLSTHRDLGGSFDFDLNCADPLLNEDNFESSSSLLSSPVEKKDNNNGENISILVEMANKKRICISVCIEDTVESLYRKVSSLLRLPLSSISLLKYPNQEIRGMSSLIKDYKLNGALVRVSIIQ